MKMTKKLAGFMALAFSALLTFAFVSCANDSSSGSPSIVNTSSGSGGSGGSATGGKIAKFNISNAKNLYIASKGSSSRTLLQGAGGNDAGSTNTAVTANGDEKLYKIVANEDGTEKTEEVTCSDSEGAAVTPAETPIAVYSVTDTYLFIGYGTSTANLSKAYLVNKTSGAAFDMAKAGMPVAAKGDFKNAGMFKTPAASTSASSIYYITLKNNIRTVVQVSLSDPENLTATDASFSNDSVNYFDVDKDGNLAYSSGNPEIFRLKKSSGQIRNFVPGSNSTFWLGTDGYLYYMPAVEYADNYETRTQKILKLNADDDEEYTSITSTNSSPAFIPSVERASSWKLDFNDKIIIVSKSGVTQGNAFELMNSSKTPVDLFSTSVNRPNVSVNDVYATELGKCTAVAATANYWYVAARDSSGNAFFKRFTASASNAADSLTSKLVLLGSSYEVYAFTVSETDGITFNALRYSDGKKVIGKVAVTGGDVTIIDESGATVVALERVN